MLRQYQVLTVPGGFSYGDDIAAGRIFANQLLHHVTGELAGFRDRGGLILGICNGFQVLAKAGLLPDLGEGVRVQGSGFRVQGSGFSKTGTGDRGQGTANSRQDDTEPRRQGATARSRAAGRRSNDQGRVAGAASATLARQQATLTWNDSGRYQDLWVHLRVATDRCVFLTAGQMLYLPVAHAEGKVLFASDEVRRAVHDQKLVALQYVDEQGRFGEYPVNPNGSTDHIAGLTDPTGRILGLMPHPERFIDPSQHPHWSRLASEPIPDGRSVFGNAVAYVKRA